MRFFQSLSSYHQGFVYVTLGILFFSCKGILIKLAYQWQVEATVLMTLRMLMALPFYIAMLLKASVRHDYRQASRKHLCATGLFGVLGYYMASWLDLKGLEYLPASLERLILYSYPSMVLILAVIFLKQSFNSKHGISLILIYSGLFSVLPIDLLQFESSNSALLTGALYIFASAFAFAIYLLGAEVMMRNLSSQLFTTVAMLSASLMILIHFFYCYPLAVLFEQAWPVYVYSALIAFFCTVLPSFLVSSGIQRVGASTGSMVGGLSPILTLILAVIFLDESITALQALGFLIVIVGVLNLSRIKLEK